MYKIDFFDFRFKSFACCSFFNLCSDNADSKARVFLYVAASLFGDLGKCWDRCERARRRLLKYGIETWLTSVRFRSLHYDCYSIVETYRLVICVLKGSLLGFLLCLCIWKRRRSQVDGETDCLVHVSCVVRKTASIIITIFAPRHLLSNGKGGQIPIEGRINKSGLILCRVIF